MKTFYQVLANSFAAMLVNLTLWFALVYSVYLTTHSVFATSILSGVYMVLSAGTGMWFGSLVDHHHKKPLLLVSSVYSLASYIVGAILYGLLPSATFTDLTSPWLWTFVVILLSGVMAGNIRNIALPTLVTLTVDPEKRDKANGLVGMVSGIGYMITSVVSGFMVAHTGLWGVLLSAVAGTLLVIGHLLSLDLTEKRIVHTGEHHRKLDVSGTLRVIRGIPGLMALILFSTFNNLLGGVFMSLMDAYGLSLVSVQVWGTLWGVLGFAFVVGGMLIHRFGLGKSPLKTLMQANVVIWIASGLFTIYPSIWLMAVGGFIYLAIVPYIEAAEQTIFQNLVPHERQGRVFGFAQTIEQAASPLTAFLIGPLTQFVVIPFMTDGWGATVLGPWFGVGAARGIALVFTTAGLLGLFLTLFAWRSRYFRVLETSYHERGSGSGVRQ